MAVPRSKAELLAAIETGYARLAEDLARVPPERARERTLPGHAAGTLISPADLVAYLIGWNELVLSWHDQRRRGHEPAFPAPGFTWARLGALAQSFYDAQSRTAWPALLQRLETAKEAIVALVVSLDDDRLYGAAWYRTHSAGRMIQLNTSSPYANARRRLRAWLRQPPT